jgi:hypothetical protein
MFSTRCAQARAKIGVVGRDHDRPPLVGEPAERRGQVAAPLGIQGRGRLVHQQDRRLERERARDGDALRFAAGQLVRHGARTARPRRAWRAARWRAAPLPARAA